MGEIGDVLELLHGPRTRRYATVRGVLRNSSNLPRMGEARLRAPPSPHGGLQVVARSIFPSWEPAPDQVETVMRFWGDPPSRLHEEVESNSPERGNHLLIAERGRWWAYSDRTGAISNESSPDEEPDAAATHGDTLWKSLLDPADWIPALTFEARGSTETAGRAALVVAATTREQSWPGHTPFALQETRGADEYELLVDRERGVLLRTAALLDGEAFWTAEFEELAFDEEFPAELFVFEPPPGVEVRPLQSRMPERLTVAEAASRASFGVYQIPELTEGRWDVHAMYFPHGGGTQSKETVQLLYHRANSIDHLSVTETVADADGRSRPGLTRVEHDGLVLSVARPVPGLDAPLQVLFERHGTRLHLASPTLDEDQLLQLAVAMERVAAD